MPGGDGSGPMGQGPMTGGGFGPCGAGAGRRAAGGGFGRSFGRGFGRGMGYRNRRWAPEWPSRDQVAPTAEPNLLQRLTEELDHLRERIAGLEGKK